MEVEDATKAVLGAKGPSVALYTGPYEDHQPLFPAYRYHFLTQSKPATHLAALTHMKKSELKADMPEVLAALLAHIAKNLKRD